ncbi:hypothetical protein Tco_0752646 [Tanacetum coccineum]|uniref:Uncharacterized protein n=1 Tax=Tanacetum coccineum TaxID=301880 RepID=A0ABQ4Z8G2_9ASTR
MLGNRTICTMGDQGFTIHWIQDQIGDALRKCILIGPYTQRLNKKLVHLILTGMGDENILNVDACQTARNVGKPSKGSNKVNHYNIQMSKTNLFWKFGKFNLSDGETIGLTTQDSTR